MSGDHRRGYLGRFAPAKQTARADIAEILRAVAAGYAASGDPEHAARVRKSARILEGREQPWGRNRKHHG